MELIVEDGFGFWDISRQEITEVGVRLVLMKVLSVGSTRSLVFVVEGLPDAEFSPLGCFVGFTVCYCAVPAVVTEKVIASLGQSVYDGLFSC